MQRWALGAALAASMLVWAPGRAAAQDTTQPAAEVGSVTGWPLPRYVSLRATEGRARRGPSRSHRVDWTFVRRDMPLRLTAEFEHWRRVEDADGLGGWVHYSALTGARTALVLRDLTAMRSQPRAGAPEVALLERGVVARIVECNPAWCRLSADGLRGWVDRSALWGIDPHETLD